MIKSTSIVLLVLFTLALASAQPPDASSGHVQGTIFDSNGAVVTKVRVIFEGNGWKRDVVTNEEGHYEIDLPSSVCRVTTRSLGFCPSQRARFVVPKATQTLLNLILVVCPIANIIKKDNAGKYVGEEDRYIDPFESESFLIKQSPGLPLNLLIRYGKRQEEKGVVAYQGAEVLSGVPAGVTISYDVLTIVADRVRFNKGSLLLNAEGNVAVEDGKQQMKFGSAEVDFNARNPLTTIRGKE